MPYERVGFTVEKSESFQAVMLTLLFVLEFSLCSHKSYVFLVKALFDPTKFFCELL